MPILNRLHQKFGRLTAIGIAGRNKQGRPRWLWRCDCGRLHLADGAAVVKGGTQSCGCLMRERLRQRSTRHGGAVRGKMLPEYNTWHGIKGRCLSPTDKAFPRYGGRGITICERWRDSFANFLADMGPKPSTQHSVERIDNNKGYSPENCVWGTSAEQTRNTRYNRKLTLNGETLCMTDWATRLGMGVDTLFQRLKTWSVERALTEPLRANAKCRRNK